MPEHLQSREQPLMIVLQQEVPVRLMNISRSGCLLHISRSVRIGMVGRLRLTLDDAEYTDDVRVARCASLTDATCELGVELLWVPNVKPRRSPTPSLVWRLRVSDDGSMPGEATES